MSDQYVIADSNLRRVIHRIPVSSLVRQDDPTSILITFAQPHKLADGSVIRILDLGTAGMNGEHVVTVVDVTKVTITLLSDPGADEAAPAGSVYRVSGAETTGAQAWPALSPTTAGLIVEQAGCQAGTNGSILLGAGVSAVASGRAWGQLYTLDVTTFASITGNISGITLATIPADRTINGNFTAVNIVSGSVLAYYK